MSNKSTKLKLFEKNPHCFYCGCLTVLTNIDGGPLPDNAATIEHLVSRLSPYRWVSSKNKIRKVIACNKCNRERSKLETLCLSRAEILQRSNGFSLSPKGNPTFKKPLTNVKDVVEQLKDKYYDAVPKNELNVSQENVVKDKN